MKIPVFALEMLMLVQTLSSPGIQSLVFHDLAFEVEFLLLEVPFLIEIAKRRLWDERVITTLLFKGYISFFPIRH